MPLNAILNVIFGLKKSHFWLGLPITTSDRPQPFQFHGLNICMPHVHVLLVYLSAWRNVLYFE